MYRGLLNQIRRRPQAKTQAVAVAEAEFTSELLVEPEDHKAPAVSAVFQALKRVDPMPEYRAALRRRQRRREARSHDSSPVRQSVWTRILDWLAPRRSA